MRTQKIIASIITTIKLQKNAISNNDVRKFSSNKNLKNLTNVDNRQWEKTKIVIPSGWLDVIVSKYLSFFSFIYFSESVINRYSLTK